MPYQEQDVEVADSRPTERALRHLNDAIDQLEQACSRVDGCTSMFQAPIVSGKGESVGHPVPATRSEVISGINSCQSRVEMLTRKLSDLAETIQS